MSKAHLVKHFQVENIPCATIYWIIKHFKDGLPCENKTRKGHPNKLNKQQQPKFEKFYGKYYWCESKKIASKFNVLRSRIHQNF